MTRRFGSTPVVAGLTVVVGLAVTVLLGGCGHDAICGGGEYPVQAVGGTGRQCVPDQQDPPTGFTRYPAGKTPKHVDDQWDVYWRTHALDEHGNIVASQ